MEVEKSLKHFFHGDFSKIADYKFKSHEDCLQIDECKHIFNSSTYHKGCCISIEDGKCRQAIYSNDISIVKTLENFDQEPYLAICVKNSRKK